MQSNTASSDKILSSSPYGLDSWTDTEKMII